MQVDIDESVPLGYIGPTGNTVYNWEDIEKVEDETDDETYNLLAVVMGGQDNAEEEVKKARKDLEMKLKNCGEVPLGEDDIHGKWRLYSSEYLNWCIHSPTQDPDDYDSYEEVGTLYFAQRLPQYDCDPGEGKMAGVLDIYGRPNKAIAWDLEIPKYASLDAFKWTFRARPQLEILCAELNFLGTDMLELIVSGETMDNIYFVGIRDLTAVKRQAEDMDDEEENHHRTDGSRPENNKRLKTTDEEHGVPEDSQESGSDSGFGDDDSSTGGSPAKKEKK